MKMMRGTYIPGLVTNGSRGLILWKWLTQICSQVMWPILQKIILEMVAYNPNKKLCMFFFFFMAKPQKRKKEEDNNNNNNNTNLSKSLLQAYLRGSILSLRTSTWARRFSNNLWRFITAGSMFSTAHHRKGGETTHASRALNILTCKT